MVSHHPAKFGDHSRCGSGDIMFSVAEEKHGEKKIMAIERLFTLQANAISFSAKRKSLLAASEIQVSQLTKIRKLKSKQCLKTVNYC